MPVAKPDIQGIKKYLELRKKGLTYRYIGEKMGKDPKTLTRWQNYIRTRKVIPT